MYEFRLTDGERIALVSAVIDKCLRLQYLPNPDDNLVSALAKISGTDTVVTVQRSYPPRDKDAQPIRI